LAQPIYEGIVHGNLGNLHFGQGRIAEAEAHFEAAIAISREVGNRRGEGIFLGYLGNLHFAQGRNKEARTHYETALAILSEAGIRRFEAVVRGNLGRLLFHEGRVTEAKEALAQAEAVLRSVNDSLELAKFLCGRAEVEHRSGNVEVARSLLVEIQALAAQIGLGPESQLGCMLAKLRQSFS
jgi:tetratricopeptide (TPR) repeat protein